MDDPKKPWKALIAGLTAALGTAFTALSDNGITAQEGVGIALTTVIAVGAVYGVRNPKV